MAEVQSKALSCVTLFHLCSLHPDEDEHWAEFHRRYYRHLIRGIYQAYGRLRQPAPPTPSLVAKFLQAVYLKILRNDCLVLRSFRGRTEAAAQMYLVYFTIKVTESACASKGAGVRPARISSIRFID